MKRPQMLRAVDRFLKRIDNHVSYYRYLPSEQTADAPYRQRKKQYQEPITLLCTISERKTEDLTTGIGNAILRRFEVGISPSELLKAFHPRDYDDPRRKYDPALILSTQDVIEVYGIRCRIQSITRHGDEGGGPLWYLIFLKEDME